MTANGRVDLTRVRWHAPGEGSDSPLDRLMDVAEATVTVGVRQLCCELGIHARSFARGAQSLRSAAQVVMGEELFRAVVESEGKAAIRASADGPLEIDWSASACKTPLPAPAPLPTPLPTPTATATATATPAQAVPAAPAAALPEAQPGSVSTPAPAPAEVSRLYVSADGVLVPTTTAAEKQKRRATTAARRRAMPRDKRRRLPPLRPPKKGSDQTYKQVYLTAFYDQSKARRLIGVTRGGPNGLARVLRRDAARVRLRGAAERVGLVDGAVCLRNHLEVLPLTKVVLDFRHLAEHVNAASRKTLGDGTDAGKAFSDEVLHAARHAGYEPMFEKLADWRGDLRGGKRREANGLLNYVAERREMIAYDECERRGWDVGSGPIESMCGVTTDRIKGRGRRWDIDNAESLMALEALHQSNLWATHWANALAGLK